MASDKQGKRIAALVPNVLGFSPGQRVRIELWKDVLERAGWALEFYPFEDNDLHKVLYSPGNLDKKVRGLLRCLRNQYLNIKQKIDADVLFIYREVSLAGPSILERVAGRTGIPIIYDIDDPVFVPYKSPANSWASLLKFSKKTHSIFRLSTQIIAINELIAGYAAKFNPNVAVIPNCIDTARYLPKDTESHKTDSPKLVWIGSQSTMQNLVEIADPLRRLQEERETPLLIIGAGATNLGLKFVENRQWSASAEVSDLQEGSIGLLPLNDLPWNNWKFFFKAIQYMAIGIPVVARRMGSNSEIIQDGVNGFLVETKQDWYDRLKLLSENSELRLNMGRAARRTVEKRFSLDSVGPKVVEVFEKVLTQRRQIENR